MPIVAFCSKELKETGQSLSIAALATYMSIKHNNKMLLISTDFKQRTLEDCFWKQSDTNTNPLEIDLPGELMTQLDSGIEGLLKLILTNRATPEIIKNYSKTVLKDRLDVLVAPTTKDQSEYNKVIQSYSEVIKLASKYYDLILIDIDKEMNSIDFEKIINLSDVVIFTLNQRLNCINEFAKLRAKSNFYKQNRMMLAVGKYDAKSKYTAKNISRYLKEKKIISVIPYNTLFAEACSEAKIVDFFLKLRNVTEDDTDKNKVFVREIAKLSEDVLLKIKETQQMRQYSHKEGEN